MAITAAVDVANVVLLIERFGANETLRAISICNRASSANTVRIWAVPADTTRGNEHALVFDLPIRANETIIIQMHDIRMTTYEEIWAQGGSSAELSVILFNSRTLAL